MWTVNRGPTVNTMVAWREEAVCLRFDQHNVERAPLLSESCAPVGARSITARKPTVNTYENARLEPLRYLLSTLLCLKHIITELPYPNFGAVI
jgi:hypothetical protein